MGVIADILANAKSFDPTPNRPRRTVYNKLKYITQNGLDFDYPDNCLAINQVQSIAQHVAATGGTYTLTFTLASGESFTTGNLAHSASTATVTTAINSAASAVVGWTNGDIAVGGSALSAGAMTFTFSGASVAGNNHPEIVINGALLTAAGTAGAATTTTPGTADPAVDEVQSIAPHVAATGGTYILNVLGNDTAAIAWNANAATIQTAVDLVSGVTAGHVAITGGPLSTTALTITFSGADVDEQEVAQTTIDGALLTIAGTAGDESKSTPGQSKRSGWAALLGFSIISTAPPVQGVAASSVTVINDTQDFPHGLDNETVKAIIDEIAIHDVDPGSKEVLLAAIGI